MGAITIADLKDHLRLDRDDTTEDALLGAKIAAAEELIEGHIGGAVGEAGPAPILEAVRQIAGHLYENRGGNGDGIPTDTLRLLSPYREWAF